MPIKAEVIVNVGDIIKVQSAETEFSGLYLVLQIKSAQGINIYNLQDLRFPDSFWTFFSDDDILEILA